MSVEQKIIRMPQERTVRTIARGLGKFAESVLEKRFFEQADAFRRAATPYFADAATILSYQRGCLDVLRSFYDAATKQQAYMLQLIACRIEFTKPSHSCLTPPGVNGISA